MAEKTFADRICALFYLLMKYVLAIALTAVMCIPAIYHFSFENSHEVVENPLHKSFNQEHRSLKQKLDESTASYLYGKNP